MVLITVKLARHLLTRREWQERRRPQWANGGVDSTGTSSAGHMLGRHFRERRSLAGLHHVGCYQRARRKPIQGVGSRKEGIQRMEGARAPPPRALRSMTARPHCKHLTQEGDRKTNRVTDVRGEPQQVRLKHWATSSLSPPSTNKTNIFKDRRPSQPHFKSSPNDHAARDTGQEEPV